MLSGGNICNIAYSWGGEDSIAKAAIRRGGANGGEGGRGRDGARSPTRELGRCRGGAGAGEMR